jgi:Clr5 domain
MFLNKQQKSGIAHRKKGWNTPKYTSQEWLQMQSTIHRLYIVEDKTLDDVRQIMKTKHKFDASGRMYKKRLLEWGMQTKNLPKSVWRALDAIQKDRELREGKETVFYVYNRGKVHRKLKNDINKYYKKNRRYDNVLPNSAMNEVPSGITIQYHTPTGSPVSSPRLQQIALPQIPTSSTMPTDQQSGIPFIQSPSRSNQPMLSSPSPEPSPSVRPLSSPSLSGSFPSAFSDPDTNVTRPPFVIDLIRGFLGLVTLTRCDFALELAALNEATEWVASTFMASYYQTQHRLSQSCKQNAEMQFTQILRYANGNVLTGLAWLVSTIGSLDHVALEDSLKDCCATIDDVCPDSIFSPLFRYALAMVSKDQPNILKYGSVLHNCHNATRSIWGSESSNFLVSCYYLIHYYYCIAHYYPHSKYLQQAVSLLKECLPLSEQLMGKNHLVTINFRAAEGRIGSM